MWSNLIKHQDSVYNTGVADQMEAMQALISLGGGGHYFFIYDCNHFHGLCFTLRANVILSGHGYYKLIVGHPLCRGRYRRVGMGGV